MVNLELHIKNAPPQISLEDQVNQVIVRVGRLLTNKLFESGQAIASELLAFEQDTAPLADESELYLTSLDCELVKNIKTFSALTGLQRRYEAVEERLLNLLAQRARRELNTITEDPPLATRLAQEMESLLATSLVRSEHFKKIIELEERLGSHLQTKVQTLLARPQVSWTDIMRADKPLPAADFLWWGGLLKHAVTTLESTMQRLEDHFGKDPHEELGRGIPLTYRQIMKSKNGQLRGVLSGNSRPARTKIFAWQDEAAQLLIDRNYFGFAHCMDETLSHSTARLDVWNKNEGHRSAKPKQRLLDVENFLYADGIRRSLHHFGESTEDTLICADKLLSYCHDNNVAAAELMDDEIWTLYPKINRENLKQARLKVRHSDAQFPLSVAHREWISQLSEQALAPARA